MILKLLTNVPGFLGIGAGFGFERSYKELEQELQKKGIRIESKRIGAELEFNERN